MHGKTTIKAMLAIYLPNSVSRSNNTRSQVKCLMFFSCINPISVFQQNCNNVSQYKTSQKSVHWESCCCTWTGKQTGSNDEANDSRCTINHEISQT